MKQQPKFNIILLKDAEKFLSNMAQKIKEKSLRKIGNKKGS